MLGPNSCLSTFSMDILNDVIRGLFLGNWLRTADVSLSSIALASQERWPPETARDILILTPYNPQILPAYLLSNISPSISTG
jgi:hypothetical protein